jgi:hypothetical protein
MAPLLDDSDLLTATPKTFYKDIPYIQIIQDNKVVEPVNGVINLTYTPFVFRYVSTFRAPLYVNFSFNNTFQNSAHEGLDPFLPCPNPYCEDNQLNMEQHHIITIDDNKYNFMLFCRDDKYVSYDEFWAWDRCNIFGTAEWHTSHLHEHDLREFGLLVDNNIVVHPISELKSFGDKIYITAYCVAINRALKEAIPYQDQIFQLIKIILQFEE